MPMIDSDTSREGKTMNDKPDRGDNTTIAIENRRRWLIRLAAGVGLLPLLAACDLFDDDDDDDDTKTPSDLRLKENVIRIGTTRHGLPFYTFNYVGKPERYAGLIAQDVLSIMPEAVSIADDGFYRVDYQRLQIRMLRLN
jgi:hypothetical protein